MVSKIQMFQAANIDLLTHQSLKITIVSVKIYHFLYKLDQQKSVKANWRIFFIVLKFVFLFC